MIPMIFMIKYDIYLCIFTTAIFKYTVWSSGFIIYFIMLFYIENHLKKMRVVTQQRYWESFSCVIIKQLGGFLKSLMQLLYFIIYFFFFHMYPIFLFYVL